MRSGPVWNTMSVPCLGIISACAERSVRWASLSRTRWDHLRVCGEVGDGECVAVLMRDHLRVCGAVHVPAARARVAAGSSPRVRSGPRRPGNLATRPRIISACAERSLAMANSAYSRADHLRVCGAVEAMRDTAAEHVGSSPRVRSGPATSVNLLQVLGIISACAERSCFPT